VLAPELLDDVLAPEELEPPDPLPPPETHEPPLQTWPTVVQSAHGPAPVPHAVSSVPDWQVPLGSQHPLHVEAHAAPPPSALDASPPPSPAWPDPPPPEEVASSPVVVVA
jgi:hypothetical protein